MNPRMITVARESRGLTQNQLAKQAGIPQGTLSKVENGLAELPVERLEAIADVLDYPVELFDWSDPVYGFGSSSFHHRKQQSLGQTTLKKVQANLNLLIGRLRRLSEGIEISAPFRLPILDIEDHESPEEIARIARATWMLPMGPVHNVVDVIEAAGGLMLRRDLGSPRITALSINPPGARPTFLLNGGLSGDRERFTLTHEVGHLIMHEVPREEAEREADRFAAEFLMPAAEIRSSLANIDLAKAAALKRYWKTSMSSLIRRARDLDVISERRYTSLMVQMSQRGYGRNEPVEIPLEQPTVVDTMVRIHIDQHGYSDAQLAKVVGLKQQEFLMEFTPPPAGRGGLRLVH
jgi:Zn-dependent peptidase ImmA (M78 family)